MDKKLLGKGISEEFADFLSSVDALDQLHELKGSGSNWECHEVDPTYGDPQGDCPLAGGGIGVWRVMLCTWTNPDGTKETKRSAWCSKLINA